MKTGIITIWCILFFAVTSSFVFAAPDKTSGYTDVCMLRDDKTALVQLILMDQQKEYDRIAKEIYNQGSWSKVPCYKEVYSKKHIEVVHWGNHGKEGKAGTVINRYELKTTGWERDKNSFKLILYSDTNYHENCMLWIEALLKQ